MVPLKERFLLDESPAWGPSVQTRSVSDVSKPDNAKSKGAAQSTEQSSVKGKKTVRRFSDFVHSSDKDKKPPSTGSKKDVWIIRLSDVVLKCQRTGVTSRPLGAILKKDSKGKKYTGPKRNLYRFIGVDRWEPQLAFQSSLEDGASEATVVDDDVTTESGASRMS